MSKIGNHVVELQEGMVYAECRTCSGEGAVAETLPNEGFTPCASCVGTGEIQCDTGGINCPFDDYCYCEAAWDRQQEDLSECPRRSPDRGH